MYATFHYDMRLFFHYRRGRKTKLWKNFSTVIKRNTKLLNNELLKRYNITSPSSRPFEWRFNIPIFVFWQMCLWGAMRTWVRPPGPVSAWPGNTSWTRCSAPATSLRTQVSDPEPEVSFIITPSWLDVDYVWRHFHMAGGDDTLGWKIGPFVVLWKHFPLLAYCGSVTDFQKIFIRVI